MLIIGFSRSNKSVKILSDLIILMQNIRFKEQSPKPMSHVYGRFVGSAWKRDFIYQSVGGGTNFSAEVAFLKKHIPIEEYILDIPKELEITIGRSCVDREGTVYAYKQNAGIAVMFLVWLVSFGKIIIENPWADGDRTTNCLEEWGLQLAAHLGITPPKLDNITPWEFRCWLKELPIAKLREL